MESRVSVNLDRNKYIFIFTDFYLKFSMLFNYECSQQITVVLATYNFVSSRRHRDFISLYHCCRYLYMHLLSSTSKLQFIESLLVFNI